MPEDRVELNPDTVEAIVDLFLNTKRCTIYGRWDIKDTKSRKKAIEFFSSFFIDIVDFANELAELDTSVEDDHIVKGEE